MLRHNLLIILRNFKRSKSSFLINLIGLSSGLACALLVYLWVNDELLVDKFHKNDSRLYQLMEFQKNSETSIRITGSTPGLLAETVESEFPDVEMAVVATPSYWFGKFTLSLGDKSIESGGIYASRHYFSVFSFDLIQGNAEEVLADKNSIVISESTALSLFNRTDNLVGKTVEFQHEREFMISGVFKDVPPSSSQQFDFVLSFEGLKDAEPGMLNWGNSGPMTYVLLKNNADVPAFNTKIKTLIEKHIEEKHRQLFARKYSDGYLYDNYDEKGTQSGGRIEYVIMFSMIAAFILVIACINFMNLSTAKASRRVKEIGVKKSVGASRKTLIYQYLGESMLMSFISMVLAVLLADLLMPQFNLITGKNLSLQLEPRVIAAFFSITFITGLISGSYPALYLSGFNPAVVLKGRFNTSLGELWARKGLVFFQFAMSVIFIVSVVVVYRQIQFLQQKNLGYDKDNIIYFPIQGKLTSSREVFLDELRKITGVEAASSIRESLVGGGNTTSIDWEGKTPGDNTPFAARPVNYGMLELLDIKLVEGRFFSRENIDTFNVIFNETAVQTMGLKDPVGKTVTIGPRTSTIVGVVKDFHYESLRVGVQPLFFALVPQYTQEIMVKISGGKEQETIARIEQFHKQFNPGFTFDYRFLDQDYQAQYFAEQRVALLSKYFAMLAVLISCLGLFGLAAFTAERRVKEIGIRKVLGSTDAGIVYLLSADFTKIVLVSIVIALPISFVVLRQWLDGFAYKIPLEWWYFIGSGFLALFIAWLTVAVQATRASRINPATCLKNE